MSYFVQSSSPIGVKRREMEMNYYSESYAAKRSEEKQFSPEKSETRDDNDTHDYKPTSAGRAYCLR
jgi:hypothetical protein